MSVDDGRCDTCSKPLHDVEEAFELTGMMSSDESTILPVSGMAFCSQACEQRMIGYRGAARRVFPARMFRKQD